MTKNKDINITPSKGISIVIKNDFTPPPIKPKKKRKYKKRVNTDLLKMPTMPSYIPGSGDVSYIKPQYAATTLNRSMIFPGVPQSLPQLTPPPQLPQLTPPPPQPQLPAPPVNFNFDGSFGRMLENMMPRQYGYKPNSYDVDILDDDIIDALPKPQQDKYIEKQIKPQIEEQLKDIEFDNEDEKIKFSKEVINIKASRSAGTRHANKLDKYDSRYDGNDYYKQNYISRLQEIIDQDVMKTRFGMKTVPIKNKQKAKDLLEIIGVIKEIPKEKMALTEEEKIEKIYNEDLKKYKERYISKNKKYETYTKEQKDKFNKDLEEIFKQGFISTTIINQSLQDKKQKDEMMKKVREQITLLKQKEAENKIKKLDRDNEIYFKDIEERVKIAEAWVEHIKNKQDEVIKPQKELVKREIEEKMIQQSIEANKKQEEEKKMKKEQAKIKREETKKKKLEAEALKKQEEEKKAEEEKAKKKSKPASKKK